MGKLDEFFKLRGEKESRRSDLEILEVIEDALKEKNIDYALLQLRNIQKDHNLFLALRMVLREITSQLKPSQEEGGVVLTDSEVRVKLKELTLLVNTLPNPLYRAILLADLAVVFYYIQDDLSGDMALKAAIDLVLNNPSVLREIVLNLVKHGLLEKAGYAMKLVKDPEKLDVVLSQLSEKFYREGDIGKAMRVLEHINNPFHKAMALYYIASIEAEKNSEEALKILDVAFKIAEKIEDPNARFEANMKLYDLKHSIEGTSVNLMDVLSKGENPRQ